MRRAPGALLLASLLWVGSARATLTEEQAAILFEEGLARFDAGDPRGAAERWERVYAEGDPARAWRVLYNLGLAYEAASDRPRSLERFEAFVRRAGEQAGQQPEEIEARRQDAVERANRLRPLLGRLRVAASATGERVEVRVGELPPRDAPFDIYVEPGTYEVQMGEGPRAVRSRATLAGGQTVTVEARQRPAPKPPPPPPKEPPVHPGILIAGGSLTVASVALPLGLFFHAQDLREQAAAIPTFDPDYATARDRYEDFRTGYFAAWALPSLFAATTLTLLVVNVASTEGEAPAADVTVGPTGGSVAVAFE